MTEMLDFSVQLLNAIADFLSAPPMIYIFSLLALAICFRIFFRLCGIDR